VRSPFSFTIPKKVSNSNGIPIAVVDGHQSGGTLVSDGCGGAILIWEDDRNCDGKSDLYGQRINTNGSQLWGSNGIPLINGMFGTVADQRRKPKIISDGNGGAIFIWEETRYWQKDIYAQYVNPDGIKQWPNDGVPIAVAPFPNGSSGNNKQHATIVTDGAGGAVIIWVELANGFNASIWAQRISNEGSTMWPTNGMPIAFGGFDAYFPRAVNDGSNAIIAWSDQRENDGIHIYMQKVNGYGQIQWQQNGTKISPPTGQVGGFSIVGDGNGGAIVTWVDNRDAVSSDSNIYAQRISSDGQILWQENGIPICTRERLQYSPKIANIEDGFYIITWEDQGVWDLHLGEGVVAQKISNSGDLLWAIDGVIIGRGLSPQIVADHKDGAIIVYYSNINPPSIHAQRVDGSGKTIWNPDGFEIIHSTNQHSGFEFNTISDEMGGIITIWTDGRYDATYWDVFADRIIEKSKSMPWIQLLLL
jgi:hypothetical protein